MKNDSNISYGAYLHQFGSKRLAQVQSNNKRR